jgi:hypothetical protein
MSLTTLDRATNAIAAEARATDAASARIAAKISGPDVETLFAAIDKRVATMTRVQRATFIQMQITGWETREAEVRAGRITPPAGWTAFHMAAVIIRLRSMLAPALATVEAL